MYIQYGQYQYTQQDSVMQMMANILKTLVYNIAPKRNYIAAEMLRSSQSFPVYMLQGDCLVYDAITIMIDEAYLNIHSWQSSQSIKT